MIITTAINKRRINGRLARATMFCLLAFAAALSPAGDARAQWVTNGNNINNTNPGNVGIGTASPRSKLDVKQASDSFTGGLHLRRNTTNDTWAIVTGNDNSLWMGYAADASLADAAADFTVYPLVLTANNMVGIGTHLPTEKLHVVGNGRVTGNLIVDGNLSAKYQDVAEWVPSTQKLTAGTVVILDTGHTNHVIASSTPYDTRVAGVVSAQPGIALGEAGEGKALVATMGRVRVRVNATRAPVRVGDLLVTGDTPGVAMLSQPLELGGVSIHRPGTIIGKALEPLERGTGEILVLLSLQ